MEASFRSKRDGWLSVLISLAAGVLLLFATRDAWAGRWVPAGVLAAGAAAILWTFYGTSYRVTDTQLHIRCGVFRWNIDRASITAVSPSREEIASPASSLDRLEIRYANGRKRVLVSPEDKVAFCAALDIHCTDACRTTGTQGNVADRTQQASSSVANTARTSSLPNGGGSPARRAVS